MSNHTKILFISIILIIALTLTLAIFIKRESQSHSSRAQSNCRFSASAYVYKDKIGNRLEPSEIDNATWGISNNRQNNKSPTIKFFKEFAYRFETNSFLFGQLPGQYQRGEKASIRLFGPETSKKFRIKEKFCLNMGSGHGCPKNQYGGQDKSIIDDIVIDCGVDIVYGWVVEEIIQSPTVESACRYPCIYSEKINGADKCFVGSCPPGNPLCQNPKNINSGCQYSPQCGNFAETGCPKGETILSGYVTIHPNPTRDPIGAVTVSVSVEPDRVVNYACVFKQTVLFPNSALRPADLNPITLPYIVSTNDINPHRNLNKSECVKFVKNGNALSARATALLQGSNLPYIDPDIFGRRVPIGGEYENFSIHFSSQTHDLIL